MAPSRFAYSDSRRSRCSALARTGPRFLLAPPLIAPPCEVGSFAVHLGWHPRAHSDPAQQWLREQVTAAARG